MAILIDAATGAITLDEVAAPATPAAGKVALYPKSDGALYSKNDSGVERLLSSAAIALYDNIAPNDSGGYLFDVSAGDALGCVHLELIYSLKSSVSASFDSGYMTYNGDNTGTNYRYGYIAGDGTTPSSANANERLFTFTTAGTSTDADSFASGTIFIPFFQSTVFEKVAIIDGEYRLTTAPNKINLSHRWVVTPAAITAIRLRPDGYSTDTWNSNSRVTLRGWRL